MMNIVAMEMAGTEMSISDLITNIQLLIERKAEILSVIESPRDLIIALEDLDSLVEMYEVKHAITEQIQLLIILAYKSSKGRKASKRFDGHRLHTVFYGPPGVGKSRTARCLARIWEALGVFSELLPGTPDSTPTPTPATGGASTAVGTVVAKPTTTETKLGEIGEKINDSRKLFLDLCTLYTTAASSPTRMSIFAGTRHTTPHAKWETALHTLKDAGSQVVDLLRHLTESPTESRIVVCGREDFIAAYSGQTAEKSKSFLMSHRGKCIIIEEAYSLCTGEKDDYGKEALVVLNRFMEEYGDQVVVIFTGYREELMETIFTYQPGLIRRCHTAFEIKGYSAEGLAAIFTKQLREIDWLLDASVDLMKFFTENSSSFPAYGGDTERLALHCKLVYSGDAFADVIKAVETSTPIELSMLVTNDILLRAFTQYKAAQLRE